MRVALAAFGQQLVGGEGVGCDPYEIGSAVVEFPQHDRTQFGDAQVEFRWSPD